MEYSETALLVGGHHDGRRVETYPGQGVINMPRLELSEFTRVAASGAIPDRAEVYRAEVYRLHRVHDSRGFHRLIGLLENDPRGPMQALYEGYSKEKTHA